MPHLLTFKTPSEKNCIEAASSKVLPSSPFCRSLLNADNPFGIHLDFFRKFPQIAGPNCSLNYACCLIWPRFFEQLLSQNGQMPYRRRQVLDNGKAHFWPRSTAFGHRCCKLGGDTNCRTTKHNWCWGNIYLDATANKRDKVTTELFVQGFTVFGRISCCRSFTCICIPLSWFCYKYKWQEKGKQLKDRDKTPHN